MRSDMNSATPPKTPFQFSLLTLVLAVVFVGACFGLCLRREWHAWGVCFPETWIAFFSGVPLGCIIFSEFRERFGAWRDELETKRPAQLVGSVLLAWVVAYVWSAIGVVIHARNSGLPAAFLLLLLAPVWLICLVRLTGAVYGLTRKCGMFRIFLTAIVVLGLCCLFSAAQILLTFVHLLAGGSL